MKCDLVIFTFIKPATPSGELCMRVASFYELLKISLTLLVKTLAYTTGTTSKHQRATWPELYPKSIVFLRIIAWHMRVFSHLPNVCIKYVYVLVDLSDSHEKNAFLPFLPGMLSLCPLKKKISPYPFFSTSHPWLTISLFTVTDAFG